MTYVQNHIPKGKKRPQTALKAKYLTIHSTGNPASTAQNERDWLTNPTNTSSTSWHIVVDEKQTIEAIPLTEVAYHAGSSAGNTQSIGLEICESGDRERTIAAAVEAAAQTLKALGLNASALRQHYDWNEKNCPRILRDTGRWAEFVERVKKIIDGNAVKLDNTPDNYAVGAIKWAQDGGILKGDDKGDLKLHSTITRQDMLVMLHRALEIK